MKWFISKKYMLILAEISNKLGFISKSIYKILGWKTINKLDTKTVPQAIIAAAPHTTNWDFFYTVLGMRVMGVKMNFLIKDAFFFFPLNIFMKSIGGIPVDRSKKNNLVRQVVDRIKNGKINYLAISAEGTRSYTDKWKSGFYYMAKEAGVPLYLGALDYKRKLMIIEKEQKITDNFEADLQEMQAYYKTIYPKYPSKSNLHS